MVYKKEIPMTFNCVCFINIYLNFIKSNVIETSNRLITYLYRI